ncbi:MAG TPA: DUF6069 family protein [Marmoricola sp.]|nr:DUF6069 family protein [Marmoricola sp.]
MTEIQECRPRQAEVAELWLMIGLEVAALLLWAVYDAAGIALTVRVGAGVSTIDVAGVAVTASLVAVAAIVLYRLLARWGHGLRTWSVVAGAVWAVSFLGPLGATTMQAGWALASFHLLVGGGMFFGVRRIHGR